VSRPVITRFVPLLDVDVSGGDGRTVTAYAATFAEAYEVNDQYGHYDEILNRASFNQAAGRGFPGVQPLFNHGRTIHGASSEKWSSPIGVPESIKADGRGLLTVTRYNKTSQGDEALELVRSGSVRFQSFSGPVVRSAQPRSGPNGRPVIERLVLGLRDYGPCTFAVNMGAEIVAVRSQLLADELLGDLSPDERREVIAQLQQGLPQLEPLVAPDLLEQTAGGPPAPVFAGPSVEMLALVNANRRRQQN